MKITKELHTPSLLIVFATNFISLNLCIILEQVFYRNTMNVFFLLQCDYCKMVENYMVSLTWYKRVVIYMWLLHERR